MQHHLSLVFKHCAVCKHVCKCCLMLVGVISVYSNFAYKKAKCICRHGPHIHGYLMF